MWERHDFRRAPRRPYIEPRLGLGRTRSSPWENPFIKGLNGRVRDKLLILAEFATLLEVQVLSKTSRIEYTHTRPTPPSVVSPPPSSQGDGTSINQRSHSISTSQWGRLPVTGLAFKGVASRCPRCIRKAGTE